MKTAVEWLIEEYINGAVINIQIMKKALEMEKEQIIKAHEYGFYSPPFRKSRRSEANQYYNETFKSE